MRCASLLGTVTEKSATPVLLKRADKTVGPVFLSEFSAVRTTTEYVGSKVQGASPWTAAMWNLKLPVTRGNQPQDNLFKQNSQSTTATWRTLSSLPSTCFSI
jgi:hypothetical protein